MGNKMETWTELEAEIEPELLKWAQVLGQIIAKEALKEAEFDARVKAAKADAEAKLQEMTWTL